MPRALPSPIADTKTVRELVEFVMRGRVRIPVYQRNLEWGRSEVLALFDSIYRGYPMGSLLFHEREADAKTFKLGPLTIRAPEHGAALFVVDGQQRLVALTASTKRPDPLPTTPVDDYVVYFDAREEAFCAPSQTGKIPDTWVPLTQMLDPAKLSEWVFEWVHGRDKALRQIVFEAGARLRDYKIPMYTVVVDGDAPELLGEIFHRVNSSGKPLKWPVIHDALYGHAGTGEPATLTQLAEALVSVGMGRPEEQVLLRCLIAFEGKDVTRSPGEHQRSTPKFLQGSAARALPTLRRVLAFLRDFGKIPHLRLLPRSAPMVILTRFFRLHPEPAARSLELLSRWLWRSLGSSKRYDERTFQRRGVSDIDAQEEPSVQRLLDFLPRDHADAFEYPSSFDARAANSRIVLLVMASLGPQDPTTGHPIDVAELIESNGLDAFRQIVAHGSTLKSDVANRILLPGDGLARVPLQSYAEDGAKDEAVVRAVMASHAFSNEAARSLVAGPASVEAMLIARREELERLTKEFVDKLASWGRSDRPSIAHLLDSAG